MPIFDNRQSRQRSILDQISTSADLRLDRILNLINDEITPPCRIRAASPASLVVTVDRGLVQTIDGSSGHGRSRVAPMVNGISTKFSSATITFPSATGGTITVSPGTNSTLTCPATNYVNVLIVVDSDGTNLRVLQGTPGSNPAFLDLPDISSIQGSWVLGYVLIHVSGGGAVDTITNDKIYQFFSDQGSMSHTAASSKVHGLGSGDGNVVGTAKQQTLTNKDYDGGTASDNSRVTIPKAAYSTLSGLTRKAGSLWFDTTSNNVYFDNGTTLVAIPSGGAGGVSGPASSTDNAFARWDGGSGALLQDSVAATLDDSGNASFLSLTATDLTASKAVFTDASKKLVSVNTTGSGNVVLDTSPVLVTPTLGFASATSIEIVAGGIVGAQKIVYSASAININNSALKVADTGVVTIAATSNQLVLSSSNNALTINSGTSAAARIYTIPDAGATADFIMNAGDQTIGGTKTFSSTISGSINGNAATSSAAYMVAINTEDNTNGTRYITFVDAQTGNNALKTDVNLTYNSSTNTLTAVTFSGALSGNATSATNATNIAITADTTNADRYITFVDAQTGNNALKTDVGLKYNPSTDTITATNFTGNAATVTTASDNTNTIRYISFLGATSGNQSLLVDSDLTYTPATNTLAVAQLSGNASSVTNGVYTSGDQTIGGNKTFSGTTVFQASVSTSAGHKGGWGLVPCGGIIAYNPGYYGNGSNGTFTITGPATNDIAGINTYINTQGWYVCNGAAVNNAASPIWNAANRYLPNITDNRFVMGSTAVGSIGGNATVSIDHTHSVTSNVAVAAHTITQPTFTTPAHYHGMGAGATAATSLALSGSAPSSSTTVVTGNTHTITQPTFTTPAHYHGMGAGATAATSLSGTFVTSTVHSVQQPTFNVPGHYHGMGAGATAAVDIAHTHGSSTVTGTTNISHSHGTSSVTGTTNIAHSHTFNYWVGYAGNATPTNPGPAMNTQYTLANGTGATGLNYNPINSLGTTNVSLASGTTGTISLSTTNVSLTSGVAAGQSLGATSKAVTGSIGLVTGGVDGNASFACTAGTAVGVGDHTTSGLSGSNSVTGTIGLVTGGVDGNAALACSRTTDVAISNHTTGTVAITGGSYSLTGSNSVTGTIGLVTGGVDGNAALACSRTTDVALSAHSVTNNAVTSGAASNTSINITPTYLSTVYIVRVF